MNLLEKIALVGQRMKSEQISLKESLMASSRVSVSDDSVDGVDRLIYNHCLNKKNLSDFLISSTVRPLEAAALNASEFFMLADIKRS